MSFVVKLMIAGWTSTLGMIAVCALHDSGRLFSVRKRIASSLEVWRVEKVRVKEGKVPGADIPRSAKRKEWNCLLDFRPFLRR